MILGVHQLDRLFLSSARLGGFYNRTVVRGIVPFNDLRRPSVRIEFRTYFNRRDPTAIQKLGMALLDHLTPGADNGRLLDNWTIDLNSVNFAGFTRQ